MPFSLFAPLSYFLSLISPFTHIHDAPFISEKAHFGLFKKAEGDRNGTFSSDIRTLVVALALSRPLGYFQRQ